MYSEVNYTSGIIIFIETLALIVSSKNTLFTQFLILVVARLF